MDSRQCVICGREFTPSARGRPIVCSAVCRKERKRQTRRASYLRNREKEIAAAVRWGQEHPESRRASRRRWEKRHPAEAREHGRRHREKHRLEINAKKRADRRENPEVRLASSEYSRRRGAFLRWVRFSDAMVEAAS